jgi:poly(ADP-ribose) glycohydrolase
MLTSAPKSGTPKARPEDYVLGATSSALPSNLNFLAVDRFSLLESDEPLVPFWDLLEALLGQQVDTVLQFIELLDTIHAVLRRPYRSDFGFLRHFMQVESCCQGFFRDVWPTLKGVALDTPSIFPSGTLKVLTHQDSSIIFSRREIACLVIHQFLCSVPTPVWFQSDGSPDFHIWYATEQPHASAVHAYLTALFVYFARFASRDNVEEAGDSDPAITMRLHTYAGPNSPDQLYFSSPLCKLKIIPIKEASTHLSLLGLPNGASVISANKSIGFGRTGTQEEVNVGSSPEACPAVLLTPVLRNDQVLVVEGAEALVSIKGYGRQARLDSIIDAPALPWARRTMLFMDALELDAFDGTIEVPDLLPGHLDRELMKAYTAFASREPMPYEEIVTGLWGCRSFCGDEQIKTLLQWCAASLANVPLMTMVISEERAGFIEKLTHFSTAVCAHDTTVREVYCALNDLRPSDPEARSAFAAVERAIVGIVGSAVAQSMLA